MANVLCDKSICQVTLNFHTRKGERKHELCAPSVAYLEPTKMSSSISPPWEDVCFPDVEPPSFWEGTSWSLNQHIGGSSVKQVRKGCSSWWKTCFACRWSQGWSPASAVRTGKDSMSEKSGELLPASVIRFGQRHLPMFLSRDGLSEGSVLSARLRSCSGQEAKLELTSWQIQITVYLTGTFICTTWPLPDW